MPAPDKETCADEPPSPSRPKRKGHDRKDEKRKARKREDSETRGESDGQRQRGAAQRGPGQQPTAKSAGLVPPSRRACALAWPCDRLAVARLMGQLLPLHAAMRPELEGLCRALDEGDTVCLEEMQEGRMRKKLRHLLQALGAQAVAGRGRGFTHSSSAVRLGDVLALCIDEMPLQLQSPIPALSEEQPEPPPEAAAKSQRPVGAEAAGGRRRAVGPQLPAGLVEAVSLAAGGVEEQDEEEDDDSAGPQPEGRERVGVALEDLKKPTGRAREEWMTVPHASMASIFSPGPSADERPKACADRFQAHRSQEDQASFEAMMQDRGPSLLESKRPDRTAKGIEEANETRAQVKEMMKRQKEAEDLWGASARAREGRGRGGCRPGGQDQGQDQDCPEPRKMFDSHEDMVMSKPVDADSFARIVNNSVSGLSQRFSRSHIASSFL